MLCKASTRAYPLNILLAALLTFACSFGPSAYSQQPGDFGLNGLQPLTDQVGEQVRGASSSSSVSGMSFISAMLLDPATGSTMNSRSTSSTGSSSQGVGIPTNASQNAISQVGFSMQIESSLGSFNGSVSGSAGGFSFSATRL